MSSAKGVGIPIKLMHEAEGHVVTVIPLKQPYSSPNSCSIVFSLRILQVELKGGESYRGELHEAEDNWNCQLRNVTATAKVCCCGAWG